MGYLLEIVRHVCYWRNMNEELRHKVFNTTQLLTVNHAVTMAEELVSNYYKMSASQWLRPKYDVKTLAELSASEIVDGPFAQIIRYEGQPKDSLLGSGVYDFYKICLQDHTILKTLQDKPELPLLPFCLYIITHELIHIVRFSKFLQSFNASPDKKLAEEHRVHEITHQIVEELTIEGMDKVMEYYHRWRTPLEQLKNT